MSNYQNDEVGVQEVLLGLLRSVNSRRAAFHNTAGMFDTQTTAKWQWNGLCRASSTNREGPTAVVPWI